MAKVTSKLQVTLPKALAEQFGIRPGDNIDWVPAGDAIRVIPAGRRRESRDPKFRRKLFRQMLERQRAREARGTKPRRATERGWSREDLYRRGRAR